jgi:hypothetical protein
MKMGEKSIYNTCSQNEGDPDYTCGTIQMGAFLRIVGFTFAHLAITLEPLKLKSMSLSTIASHDTPRLQTKATPSCVAEVPLIFLKSTFLILIFDGLYKRRRRK